MTGSAEREASRLEACLAAEALRDGPGVYALPWELHGGWGLTLTIGGTTVTGPVGEVRAWAARQAPAAGALPPAGTASRRGAGPPLPPAAVPGGG
jgi:hypothetical protein